MKNSDLTMQEAQFLVSLLECGSSNRQTALQLLAAEHLYIPTLLPKLQAHAKRQKQITLLEQMLHDGEENFDDYCRAHPEDQSCREYDV